MAPVIIPDLQPEIENGFPLKVKTAKESSPGESCVVRRASRHVLLLGCVIPNVAPCHVLLCPFVSLRLRLEMISGSVSPFCMLGFQSS